MKPSDNKSWWYRAGIIFVAMLVIARQAMIFRQDIFIDFLAYVDVSHALFKGDNPYVLKNLVLHPWGDIPIVFPGYMVLFGWGYITGVMLSSWLFLTLNIVAGLVLFFMAAHHVGLLSGMNWRNPGVRELFMAASSLLLFCSSPYLSSLRHGQCTVLIALGFLWLMIPSRFWSKTLVFAVIAVLKYSLLPLIGLMLFIKKYYLLCVIAFLIFLFFAMLPLITGHNLLQLYSSYFSVVREQAMDGGFNTFPVSGYNMMTLDFLSIKPLVLTMKMALVIVSLAIIWQERNNSSVGLNLLLLLSAITMLIVYNRIYNLIFIQLLLLLKFLLAFQGKQYWQMTIPGVILLLFVFPFSMVLKFCDRLGHLVGSSNYIYYTAFGDMKEIFPILPFVMLLITAYAFHEYFMHRNDWCFPVFDGRSKL